MIYDKNQQLVKMINQIAVNNAYDDDLERAADAVASHVRKFWAKSMKQDIRSFAEAGGEGLNDIAKAAVNRI
ncbi:formate dehydrogenase subunit delta [Hahella ganghwensis]|uniref:formate dehydrogenase subunit delta n=1 Tax=Hahella ganghwensis TaxID=286420 RepID=UPI000366B56A|nr:formate dehydrogenase subunit delta [Hahella ganghwensis]